jgi:hypothetical protein
MSTRMNPSGDKPYQPPQTQPARPGGPPAPAGAPSTWCVRVHVASPCVLLRAARTRGPPAPPQSPAAAGRTPSPARRGRPPRGSPVPLPLDPFRLERLAGARWDDETATVPGWTRRPDVMPHAQVPTFATLKVVRHPSISRSSVSRPRRRLLRFQLPQHLVGAPLDPRLVRQPAAQLHRHAQRHGVRPNCFQQVADRAHGRIPYCAVQAGQDARPQVVGPRRAIREGVGLARNAVARLAGVFHLAVCRHVQGERRPHLAGVGREPMAEGAHLGVGDRPRLHRLGELRAQVDLARVVGVPAPLLLVRWRSYASSPTVRFHPSTLDGFAAQALVRRTPACGSAPRARCASRAGSRPAAPSRILPAAPPRWAPSGRSAHTAQGLRFSQIGVPDRVQLLHRADRDAVLVHANGRHGVLQQALAVFLVAVRPGRELLPHRLGDGE